MKGPVSTYVAVDLETTGLDPKRDRIIEIGALKVAEGRIEGRWETRVNPGRQIDSVVTQLTGIADADVQNAPWIEEVLPDFLAFAGELPLLGHNVIFDYAFLKRAAVNERLPFERQGIDTLKLARRFLPALESRSLESLCRYYEIRQQAHRAPEDARAAHVLYGKLAALFFEKDEEAFAPKPLLYRAKREGPATKQQKERLYKLQERHIVVITGDIDRMTKNEASRLIDQIHARYGRNL